MAAFRFIPSHSADALAALQKEGLRWTVSHAYHGSPQYRAKLDAAGVHPRDIRSLDDLASLPLTTSQDLAEGYPLPLLSVPQQEVVRVHASSGTTGKRKILAYTRNDVETFALQMARCFELAGVRPDDRMQIAVGYGLWTAGVGFQLGCEKLGAMAIPVGPGNLEAHLAMLTDLGTTCIGCTASMALLMGEEIRRNELLDKIRLRVAIFGAEGHTPKMRREFEANLGLEDSFDIGGMTEMYGPGSSLECAHHAGLHYWADLFILEVLDPVSLTPVPAGEQGELVVTSLRKEAAPLIRYRTRDITRLIPGDCACGCAMPRHDHILGRTDDMIIFRGVNIYPGQIADVLQEFADLGAEYHIELFRREGKDGMALKIERNSDASADNDAALAARVAKALHSRVFISADVGIVDPASLPRSFGKSRRITDRRYGETD